MQNKSIISQAPMFPNFYIEPSLGIQTGIGAGYPDTVRPLQPEDYEQFPAEIKKQIKKTKKGGKSTRKRKKAEIKKDEIKEKPMCECQKKNVENHMMENENDTSKKKSVKRFKKLKESVL